MQMHRHRLYIDHNLFSGVLSHLLIYLLAYLFICVFIICWTDFLFYLRAGFRGESRRTFIFWWEQSLIQNRPIPRCLPLSVCLFLSVHQTGSLALCLCPSARLSATASPSVSVCLSFSVFPSLSLSLNTTFSSCMWDDSLCPPLVMKTLPTSESHASSTTDLLPH